MTLPHPKPAAVPHLLAACLTMAAFGCASPTPPEPTANVPRTTRGYVLISLDTLRADRLGCYGYPLPTSPFLDRLAERSTLFEHAYVQYPSTLTSHMSIFTGLYPAEHGVYPPAAVLGDGVLTLPRAFQDAGFSTAGFTEGGFMQGRFGFRHGFDLFQARDRDGSEAVEKTFERGLRFLRDLGYDEPFFLFLHTYAVHAPYDPPPAERALFWDGEAPPGVFPPTGRELARHNNRGDLLTPEVRDYYSALYDAEIRHLDGVLERFFDSMAELGLLDDTTVVITADHGEEFQEHGRMNHTQLYSEVLRVPLLFVHPDAAATRHGAPVESVDLAPTLYELARIEPQAELSGRSLAPLLGGGSVGEGEAYAETSAGSWSLIHYESGRLLHLLLYDPPPKRWVTRRLKLDTSETALAFDVRSYRDGRTLEIWDAGTRLQALEIGPAWTPVRLRFPEAAPRTLDLVTPDCTVAEDDPGGRLRCFSFQVRGVPLTRAELYDLGSDPGEQTNLGGGDGVVRSLYARLAEYRGRAGPGAGSGELDEELRKRLQALGYLD